ARAQGAVQPGAEGVHVSTGFELGPHLIIHRHSAALEGLDDGTHQGCPALFDASLDASLDSSLDASFESLFDPGVSDGTDGSFPGFSELLLHECHHLLAVGGARLDCNV